MDATISDRARCTPAVAGRRIAIHPSSECSENDDHLCSLVKRAALVGFLSSLRYFPDVILPCSLEEGARASSKPRCDANWYCIEIGLCDRFLPACGPPLPGGIVPSRECALIAHQLTQ